MSEYRVVISCLDCKAGIVREVLLGLEEEGVPGQIVNSERRECLNNAYRAAGNSKLGVGIGITDELIVLHFNKLPEQHPLMYMPVHGDKEKLGRLFGKNAARFVKKLTLIFPGGVLEDHGKEQENE